jgi:hypothetical protein
MELKEMPGVRDVISKVGGWPIFHDAEVRELNLTTESGSCLLLVHPAYTCKFLLEDVRDLELHGFSTQNVIASMTIDHRGDVWRFTLAPCFGIAGWIEVRSWSVSASTPALDTVSAPG